MWVWSRRESPTSSQQARAWIHQHNLACRLLTLLDRVRIPIIQDALSKAEKRREVERQRYGFIAIGIHPFLAVFRTAPATAWVTGDRVRVRVSFTQGERERAI
ncbi:hypothetical protein Salat_2683600 [Sesamum alatum]|uniref:Uncharacterized protein n=1 Tax=Sesamum alatum TaxID=300844 RepID=A0AAE1XPM6_9LAMI|nr:hypothetical protein Salat_2683600 [Sesamum alatum]